MEMGDIQNIKRLLMDKAIKLFPRVNKANKQINFQLSKKKVPKELRNKLSKLKSIKINWDDFEFL
jgi:hypothetical protein